MTPAQHVLKNKLTLGYGILLGAQQFFGPLVEGVLSGRVQAAILGFAGMALMLVNKYLESPLADGKELPGGQV
jgi:hypothetical protein